MRAALLLALALTGCSSQDAAAPAASPEQSRPRVDSALCDDLREVVAVRAGAAELTSETARRAAQAAVEAAAKRVLVQLGATPAAPEDVVSALRELEGGAGPDDGLDATVGAFVDAECGGR